MMAHKKAKKETKNNKSERKSCAIVISIQQKEERKDFVALLDTGTTASLASKRAVKYCKRNSQEKTTNWTTQGGSFKTKTKATISDIILPQFTKNRKINFDMHLFKKEEDDTYDFILGCDFRQAIGIDVMNSKGKIACDGIEVEMFKKIK